jgi:predicted acyl esterase
MIRTDAVPRRIAMTAGLAALTLAVTAAPATAAPTVRGSVEQVDVTGATPRASVQLMDRAGGQVATRRAGSLGGVVFRGVKAGAGYRVRQGASRSGPVTVLSRRPAPPDTGVYVQTLPAGGYGYLTTRDGTQLAVNVQLPGPAADGPYPTLVEYSGYGYANPNGAESGISPVAKLLGYAVVDVNMRGTGCSGGAFDYFDALASLDGYDAVETVARQPWAKFGKVGMLGVSYGGISQLFVAATRPPSLSAITPLSVIDSTVTTLYPGGILNTGFAFTWAKDRVHDAQPASATGGQRWALERIRQGDRTCKANQALHTEAVDLIAKLRANRFYLPAVVDPLVPSTFVGRIRTPVFLACQWTDEQTGGRCPDLAHRFTGTQRKWFTFTNGTHIDSLDPATFNRWFDFLELYVARRAPRLTPSQRALAPTIYSTAMGVPGVTLPPDPIQDQPDFASALAAYEALPPVRILFDSGAGSSTPGAPVPGFEQSFARFPLPGTRARSWYLGPGGALADARPARAGADAFTWSASARPATSFVGNTSSGAGGLWTATPVYRWRQNPAGTALSYVTAPLRADTAVVGPGALRAWIRSSAPRLDLQVTVSEVRPDDRETFVQNGWLRTSARKLDPAKSTVLAPVPTLRRADDSPLVRGRWAEIAVPLYYQGHVYRAGSRLRVTIAAPGGDQPVWHFREATPGGRATVSLARSVARPSRLILPVVPGIAVPTALPPCPSLRGQPCRTYRPLLNRAAMP